MATKDDLKAFATKDDLKGFATKDDLQQTESRLSSRIDRLENQLGRKISSNHTVNVKHHLETRDEIGKLNRQYNGLRQGLAHAADPID